MTRLAGLLILAACHGSSGGMMGSTDAPVQPDTGSGSGSGSDAGHDLSMGCRGTPPMGATLAAAPKTYAGTCPTLSLTATTMDATITSSGAQRKFWVVVPSNLMSSEHLPVIFLWHWLGGSAQDFFERGSVQDAVDQQRFIAVIPQAKGDLQFTWPATTIDGAARMEEDLTFFDDMLSCVSQQFNVNSNCVSSVGVSAGALWTDQLIGKRGEYIASFMSMSGGTGGLAIKPYTEPAHKMPGLVLWGGTTDVCGGLLNFQDISHDLETHLTSGGHFFLECVHNCGHSVPPFEGQMGDSKFHALWQFGLDHPFWLDPGESPYKTSLPPDLPAWCGVGMGGATPRTGTCTDTNQC